MKGQGAYCWGIRISHFSTDGVVRVTDTNVFQHTPSQEVFVDPLTEVSRNGARALLTRAVEAEAAALLGRHTDKLTEDGRQRLVHHGHLPEREIMTGIGPVAVCCPRVRNRVGQGPERIRFFVGNSVALCTLVEEPRSADLDPLSQGRFHGQKSL
jgi:hypothetical protein